MQFTFFKSSLALSCSGEIVYLCAYRSRRAAYPSALKVQRFIFPIFLFFVFYLNAKSTLARWMVVFLENTFRPIPRYLEQSLKHTCRCYGNIQSSSRSTSLRFSRKYVLPVQLLWFFKGTRFEATFRERSNYLHKQADFSGFYKHCHQPVFRNIRGYITKKKYGCRRKGEKIGEKHCDLFKLIKIAGRKSTLSYSID